MTGVLRHKSMLLMTTAALGFYVTTARGAGVDLDTAGGSYDISAAGGNQTIESLSGVSGTSVLLGPNTLTFGNATSQTFAGTINGTGGIVKQGSGTQILTGTNIYTGGTTINAGKLALGAGGALAAAGSVNLGASGAGFDISGAGSNQTIGALSGVAGTSVTLGPNTLSFGDATNQIFAGTISGTGGIVKQGIGTQILTGANDFSGGTNFAAGGIVVGNDSAFGRGGITVNGNAQLDNSASVSLANSINVTGGATLSVNGSNGLTLGGVISGGGGLTKNGAATLMLGGSNTYTGGTTINSGTLMITSGGALASTGAMNLAGAGAALDISAAVSSQSIGELTGAAGTSIAMGANSLTLGGAANATFGGTIGGMGGITKTGWGRQTLTGTNTYTGGTTINAGTLALGAGGALATGGFVNLGAAGADFDISAAGSQTIGALSGVAGTRVTLGPGTLSFGDATSRTFAGAISGAGSIVKQGSGRQVFNGISIHAGLTSVMAGSLIIGDTRGTSASIAGNVTVGAGATIGGHGRIGGDLTLASGSHLSPGASIGTLTVDGNLTVGQGSQLDFEFGAPGINFATFGQSDSVSVRGDLTVNASVLNVINGGGMGPGLYNLFSYGGALSFNGGGFFPPAGSAIQILTGTKQINLVNMTPGVELNFWNANGLAGPSQMGGGSGTWSVANANWTDSQGSFTGPMTPQPGFAIFGGASGTVTVDDNAGTVGALGMQFASDGYRLDGDILILQSQNATMPEIRVGDGSAASANWTATIDTVIAGINGIAKTGAGTLVLNASNAYSGGTRISAGTLSVSNDSNMSFINGGLILDGGTLRITGTGFSQTARSVTMTGNGGGFDIADAEARFTVSQALSGSGALVKSGDGTLVLSGANSYSGGTLVNGGTLQGDTESLQGNIINNARLVFDQQSDGAFAGDLSGTGTFVKSGGGKLVLSGANSYSGGTLVSGGTLLGDTASLQGNITNNAQLVFDQQSDGIFTGSLSGSGSLVKQGSGMLVFNGNGAGFAGSTVVENGMLKVGDADPSAAVLGGDVTIGTGGTLRGHGVILGSVTNQGILRPGGSVGTLTINGNLVQTANSVLQIDTTPAGEAGKLVVGGSAQLAGGLSIIGENGSWSPQTNYTILTSAGGISGTFANIDSNLAFLTPSLTYGATTIDLRLNRNDTSFASVGETRNQKAVAGAADRLGRGEVYNALVSLSAAEARAGFDALSGEIHASVKGALIDESRFARDAIGDRLRAAFDANCKAGNPVWTGKGSAGAYGQACANTAETAFWLQGYGAWGSNDGDGNAAKLSGSTGGVFIGTDIPVGSWRTGLMAGYGNSSFDADDRFSSADVDSYTLGAYAGTVIEKVGAGDIGLRFGATHSWYNIDTGRSISFAGFKAVEETSYDAQALQLFGEAGYKMQAGRASFEPFANLAYVRLHTDGYDGDGVAGLHSDSDNSDVTYTTLGLRAATDLTLGGLASTLHATLGWQHAAGDITPVARHAFAGSEPFSVAGVPVAEDAALIEAGLNFQFSEDASLAAGYKGQFGDGAVRNGFNASFNVKF
ncbi:autotransporter-associated beta strand repeat-containing protein [Brucella anthropi]|uniref:Outer membrane autotransporter barrel domain protein n=1 Tax=Brucella anthropi (strain ATCC 49188 / DSM 6882 / CCUG 24695 / JCM 21032 / LMG 3331 / NBRC 15819 / NCTC 12168 / Alc 37) TaxID=439375 RepID=A6X2Y0_BRUA4|nr:autotransporter-associated beta strand repeat-containing protein [Brucella anthropi]ABS15584.1 outer membrane autotransporter barrel domain protein [Brucella anthropi ATCC 49188]AIK41740.1 outer membrane autotransporter barrel domain protein [Brucella anthropi]QQC28132.1 autotransporter domain-containing protein [Brucella anthropi]